MLYKISCHDCDATYVGQTKRQLNTRVKEHANNIKLDSSKHLVISEHIINNQHLFEWEKVKILDFKHNFHKRIVSEMIQRTEKKV